MSDAETTHRLSDTLVNEGAFRDMGRDIPVQPVQEVVVSYVEPPSLEPAPVRQVKFRSLAAICISSLVFLFLFYEFVGSNLVHSRSQRVALEDFKKSLDLPKAPPVKQGSPVGILSVEKLGLESVVIEGTSPRDLEKGTGHFRATPLPGNPGNVVIAGRRTTFGAPFKRLEEMVEGDVISLSSRQGIFDYTVTDLRVVKPGDPDVVTATTDNRLTLVTSNPAYVASSRLVVTAVLEGEPVPAISKAGPVVLSRNETGLAGDSSALAPLILQLQLLVGLVALALYGYRRRVGRVAYLVGGPIFLVALFLVFDQLSRLLPATL